MQHPFVVREAYPWDGFNFQPARQTLHLHRDEYPREAAERVTRAIAEIPKHQWLWTLSDLTCRLEGCLLGLRADLYVDQLVHDLLCVSLQNLAAATSALHRGYVGTEPLPCSVLPPEVYPGRILPGCTCGNCAPESPDFDPPPPSPASSAEPEAVRITRAAEERVQTLAAQTDAAVTALETIAAHIQQAERAEVFAAKLETAAELYEAATAAYQQVAAAFGSLLAAAGRNVPPPPPLFNYPVELDEPIAREDSGESEISRSDSDSTASGSSGSAVTNLGAKRSALAAELQRFDEVCFEEAPPGSEPLSPYTAIASYTITTGQPFKRPTASILRPGILPAPEGVVLPTITFPIPIPPVSFSGVTTTSSESSDGSPSCVLVDNPSVPRPWDSVNGSGV